MPQILKNYIKNEDVRDYLSPPINMPNAQGKLTAGQLVSNLSRIVHVKFNRIIHTISNIFSGGEWINNTNLAKQLSANLTEMNKVIDEGRLRRLVPGQRERVIKVYYHNLIESLKINKLLKISGTKSEVLNEMNDKIQSIAPKIIYRVCAIDIFPKKMNIKNSEGMQIKTIEEEFTRALMEQIDQIYDLQKLDPDKILLIKNSLESITEDLFNVEKLLISSSILQCMEKEDKCSPDSVEESSVGHYMQGVELLITVESKIIDFIEKNENIDVKKIVILNEQLDFLRKKKSEIHQNLGLK